MVLTEFDDIGEAMLLSFGVMVALVVAAMIAEQRLVEFIKDPTGPARPGAGRAVRSRLSLLWPADQLRPARPVLTIGWVLVAVATVAVTVLVMTGVTLGVDARTLPWFTAGDRTRFGHGVARTLVMGGQFWLSGTLVVLLACYRSRQVRSLRPAVVSGVALVGMSASLWLLKVLVGRTAPRGSNKVLDGGMSFPSGHAATATVCLFLVVALTAGPVQTLRRRRALFGGAVAASAVVGVCTVVLGYHWFSDAVGGWLVGALIVVPALRWLLPFSLASQASGGAGDRIREDADSGRTDTLDRLRTDDAQSNR